MNSNNFNSIENKKLLWQLLYENDTFYDVADNQLNNVKNIFEQQIYNIDNNNSSLNLTDKNKKLIKQMIENIKVFKTFKNLKPLEEVEIKISKDFENKKEEMINLLKKPSQQEIDFNEGIDNPIKNEEMDNILSEMIKKRNMDVEINDPIKPKKVNFDLKDNHTNDDLIFLNKLKKQNNTNDTNDTNDINDINDINDNSYSKTINSKLDEILKNQIEILSYLKSN